MKKLFLILCAVIQSIIGFTQTNSDNIHLAAFSMAAAENEIIRNQGKVSDEIENVGYITKIWAAFIDNNSDLIIIGERNLEWPKVSMDDVVVALKTKHLITGGENPGVSIEPINPYKDLNKQKVIYTGGIESTNYGRIVFESDLLLKLLSTGFLSSGRYGLPNEYDLAIDNTKANRGSNPWEYIRNRSWFFPYNVTFIRNDSTVALSSITIRIDNEGNNFVKLPSQTTAYDESTIEEILSSDPLAAGPIYAKLLSQEFDSIKVKYPLLKSLESIFTLSGLFSELMKDSSMKAQLDFWTNDYNVKQIVTPLEIPTLRRYTGGLAYTYGVSGEIASTFSVTDSWSEEVIYRTPYFLKMGAIKSRPDVNSVSWVIPVGYGSPENWSDSLLLSINTIEKPRIGLLNLPENKLFKYTSKGLEIKELKPITTSGWNPKTKGNNFFGFNSTLDINMGGMDYYDSERKWKISTATQSVAIIPELKFIIMNKIGFSFEWPFAVNSTIQDEPPHGQITITYAGKSDTKWAIYGGFESPTLKNRIMLWDGCVNYTFKYPEIILTNSITMPVSFKLFDAFFFGENLFENEEDKESFTSMGVEDLQSNHGVELRCKLGPSVQIQSSAYYNKVWNKDVNFDQFSPYFALLFRVDYENDLYVVLSNQIIYNQADIESLKFNHYYTAYNLGFYYPRKFGYNNISVGYFAPSKTLNIKGGLIFNITFGGDLLFDNRKWFGKK